MHAELDSKIKILKLHYPGDTLTSDIEVLSLSLAPDSKKTYLPRLVIFTGFGEQRLASLVLAAKPFTVKGFYTTSIAVPFDKCSLKVSEWILDSGLAQLLSQFGSKKNPVLLAGVSRGAVIAATIAADETKDYEGLIMVSPLGLAQLSASTYVGRSIKDHFVNKGFLEKEERMNAYGIFREVTNHIRSNDGVINALLFAMDQQLRVARGIKSMQQREKLLAVFSGERDLIFTNPECRAALKKLLGSRKTDEILHTITGGHAAIASTTGQRQLKIVADWLIDQY